MMANVHKRCGCVRGFSWLLILIAAWVTFGCKEPKPEEEAAPAEKLYPDIHTGLATFHPLGGVIETFTVNFEKLGDVAIEEYGVVYAFLPQTTLVDLVVDGPYPKAKFREPAKLGQQSESFKVGFPTGTHVLVYRAYVKLKDGEVRYADNHFTKDY